MLDYMETRILAVANYIAENKTTVRDTAKEFGVSKSTVHKDVTERLKPLDKKLYRMVRKILDINLKERHIRGGEATRKKYKTKEKL